MSIELDEYMQADSKRYHYSDFQFMNAQFLLNFENALNHTRRSMDIINDVFIVLQLSTKGGGGAPILTLSDPLSLGEDDFDFSSKVRCHLYNVTACVSLSKEEDIIYKMRSERFY